MGIALCFVDDLEDFVIIFFNFQIPLIFVFKFFFPLFGNAHKFFFKSDDFFITIFFIIDNGLK